MAEPARATETACEKTIVQAARQFGWLVHGNRPARDRKGAFSVALKGDKGFPDLILCRPPHFIVVELKRKPNKVEPEQQRWIDALTASGIMVEVVWVPEEQDELIRRLVTIR